MAPMAAATDMVNRFQPNSSLMGIMKIPKLLRVPVLTKAVKVTAATTYQPKYRGDLASVRTRQLSGTVNARIY